MATLPENVLALRTGLPLKPAPVTLRGDHVLLTPLDLLRHPRLLYNISHGNSVALGERSIAAYDAEVIIG